MRKPLFLFSASILLTPALQAVEISREDLKKALDKNPDLIIEGLKGQKKQLFELIMQAQQEEQARRQKEEEEREKKEMDEAFKNPKKPSVDAGTRMRGKKDAKYTLVEYSDFQCPYCQRGFQTVEELLKKRSDMKFIFKNLPLSFHPHAMPAAKYFEAVALQSKEKSWEFHDKLFANQTKLGEDFYKETAKGLGIDMKKLEEDVKGKAVADKIEADIQEAKTFGFSGTPAFLLNGIPLKGAYPIEAFEEIIKRLEKEASEKKN
jgi:protein-disulfide isomerase